MSPNPGSPRRNTTNSTPDKVVGEVRSASEGASAVPSEIPSAQPRARGLASVKPYADMGPDLNRANGEAIIEGIASTLWTLGWAQGMGEKGRTFPEQDLYEVAPSTPLAFLSIAREQAVELCLMNPRTAGLTLLAEKLDDVNGAERGIRGKFRVGEAGRDEALVRIQEQRAAVLESDRKRLQENPRRLNAALVEILKESVRAIGEPYLVRPEVLESYSGEFGRKVGHMVLGSGASWADNIRDHDALLRFKDRVRVQNLDAAGINRVDPEELTFSGEYRPRQAAAAPQVGAYAVLHVRGGDLFIKATPALLEAFEAGEFSGKREADVLSEILSDHVQSGMDWVDPSEVGALTAGSLMASGVMRTGSGELRAYPGARIFWHDNYQIESCVETLRSGQEVRWTGEELQPFTSVWYTTFEAPGVKAPMPPYCDCFYVLQGGELAIQSYDDLGALRPIEFVKDELLTSETEEVQKQFRQIEDWLWEHGEALDVEAVSERQDVRGRLDYATDLVVAELDSRIEGLPWNETRHAIHCYAEDPVAFRRLPMAEAVSLLREKAPEMGHPAFPADWAETFLREIGSLKNDHLTRVRQAASHEASAVEAEARRNQEAAQAAGKTGL